MILNELKRISKLPEEQQKSVYQTFHSCYSDEQILDSMIDAGEKDHRYLAENVDLDLLFANKKKEIKTIALYYHRICNGGTERVVCRLADILADQGYRIVIVTDEAENEADYSLPDGVKRYVLDHPYHIRDREILKERSRSIRNCMKQFDVDCVIYNSWMVPQLYYDICAIKSMGGFCIIYSHGTFHSSLYYPVDFVLNNLYNYTHADAMVTLTASDRVFWSSCIRKVHQVVNPSVYDVPSQPVSKLDSFNIIWTGRVDDPMKNGLDTVRILRKVTEVIPEATLTICGGMSEEFQAQMDALISELGMEKHVELVGYTKDVQPYLEKASAFLCTSDVEGYSLSVAEAFGAGLPVVAYELPYLTLFKESDAVAQVPWKDSDAAAAAIIHLFQDSELHRKTGKKAREYALKLYRTDLGKHWNSIIQSCLEQRPDSTDMRISERDYADYVLTTHHAFGRALQKLCQMQDQEHQSYLRSVFYLEQYEKAREEIRQYQQEIALLKKQINDIYASKTYRFGDALLSVPKKLKRKKDTKETIPK